MTSTRPLFVVCFLFSLISGCSTWQFPSVYKIEVAQGNKIDEAQLKKLQPGMTQKQVVYLLGSPLIQDPLQPDRWDYYYSLKPSGHDKPQTKRLTIYFKNGLFDHYQLN